jgi:hypothetical protein
VARVVGGTYEVKDTGSESGQYDAHITATDGCVVALEVRSYGGDDWRRTSSRIETEQGKRQDAGEAPNRQWHAQVATGIATRNPQPDLNVLLKALESDGKISAGSGYNGDDLVLRHAASVLKGLGIRSVGLRQLSPHDDQPRVVVSQFKEWVGTAGSLSVALAGVFEKRGNQAKLARADADERHLYVLMEDEAAAGRFQIWSPLPPCPRDSDGVIDVLWVSPSSYPPSSSRSTLSLRLGSPSTQRPARQRTPNSHGLRRLPKLARMDHFF